MNKKTKKIVTISIIIFVILVSILACFNYDKIKELLNFEEKVSQTAAEDVSVEVETDYDESDVSYDESKSTKITLNNSNTTTSNATGVEIKDQTITISTSGTYVFSGTLTNGSIIVNATNTQTIRIILNGVNIKNENGSAINIKQADKTIITLVEGTTNTLTDTNNYVFDDEQAEEPNATIFSKDDLIINGDGILNISSNYKDAINSNNDLKIIGSSNITITSKDDGIVGKDLVYITEAKIKIQCSGDGIKSTNDTETQKGQILIENSDLNITTGSDGIQAVTELVINKGTYNITTGGGSTSSKKTTNTTDEQNSAKAIKSTSSIKIEAGTFVINSSDDAIHSNATLIINGGDLQISSGDDGLHADTNIIINSGNINITKSYEGIESTNIEINGGNITLVATDDGINVAGGNDSSAVGGRPGQNTLDSTTSSTNNKLTINNGYVYVNSSGDGLDSNGSIYINGGTILVSGPTNNGNGALDYDSECLVNGGVLVAAGSSGMLQTTTQTSTQNCVAIGFNSTQAANSIVCIKDNNNNEIITFAPAKQYQAIVVCSANFKKSETYTVYTGGSYSTQSTNGLYKDGTYSNGTKYGTFTISSTITKLGVSANQNNRM